MAVIRTGSGRHNLSPSLNLDFANSKQLDSRLSTRRNSIGSYVDDKGVIRYAGHNTTRFTHDPYTGKCLGIYSEEDAINLVTRNTHLHLVKTLTDTYSEAYAGLAPDGTYTATKFSVREAITTTPNISSGVVGVSGDYNWSIFLKAGTGRYVRFGYYLSSVGWGALSYIDLETGESSNAQVKVEQYPNGWWRVSTTQTPTNGVSLNLYPATSMSDTAGVPGATYYAWGEQFEEDDKSSFIKTGQVFANRSSRATYQDENGVVRSADVNSVRYGYAYDNGEWKPIGLMLENVSTNIAPNVSAANWSHEGANIGQVVTPNTTQVAAPDNTFTAKKADMTALGSSLTFADLIWQTGQNLAGTTRTASIWVKGTKGETLSIKLDGAGGGGTSKMHTLTGNWDRISTTTTYPADYPALAVMRVGPRGLSGSTDGTAKVFYIWGAQLEQTTGMTSYIYTYGAGLQSVTRAADVFNSVSDTRSGEYHEIKDIDFFLTQKQGTIYAEGINNRFADVDSNIVSINDGTVNNTIEVYKGGNANTGRVYVAVDGVSQSTSTSVSGTFIDGVSGKIAVSYDNSTLHIAGNGNAFTMTNKLSPIVDRMSIGSRNTSLSWDGTISKVSYYSYPLTAQELEELTENS